MRRDLFEKSWAVAIIVSLQVCIMLFCLHPFVVNWGATSYEETMPMPGDSLAESFSATRALDIGKPRSDAWFAVTQLGADRKGFFSYEFLESLCGCEFAHQPFADTSFGVGRVVGCQSPTEQGKYLVEFPVVSVDRGKSFVLGGWGGFVIDRTSDKSCRLIIRTHQVKPRGVVEWFDSRIFDIGHYVMERRMMLGIKDFVETDSRIYNNCTDSVWLLTIVISGFAGLVLLFRVRGWKSIVLPSIYYLIWQLGFLVVNPTIVNSVILVLLLSACFLLKRIKSKLINCK